MDEEKFFSFIHSLSKGQKANYIKFLNNRRNTLEEILYRRVLEQKTLNEKTSLLIRGKEFMNASIYRSYRIKITRNILGSLAVNGKKKQPTFEVIKWAVRFNLTDFASQLSGKLVEDFLVQEDLESLDYLKSFVLSLERQYGVRIDFSKKWPSNEYFQKINETAQVLEGILADLELIPRDKPHKGTRTLLDRLSKLELHLTRHKFLTEKIRIGCHLLVGELEDAIRIRQSFCGKKAAYLAGSFVEEVKNITHLVEMYAAIGDRDNSIQYAMKLGKIKTRYPVEETFLINRRLHSQAFAARKFGLVKIADQVEMEFQSLKMELDQKYQKAIYFYLGICFFVAGDLKKAKAVLSEFYHNILSKNFRFEWEVIALLCLANFEQGNYEVAENLLKKASRSGEKAKSEYSRIVIPLLRQYINQTKSPALLLSQLDSLKNYEEKSPIGVKEMEFSVWLEAKLRKEDMLSVLTDRNKKKSERRQEIA